MSVEAVVRRVELSLDAGVGVSESPVPADSSRPETAAATIHSQPLDIAVFKPPRADRFERPDPVEMLVGLLGPPLVRIGPDRLLVLVQIRLVVGADVGFGAAVVASLDALWRWENVLGRVDRVGESSDVVTHGDGVTVGCEVRE